VTVDGWSQEDQSKYQEETSNQQERSERYQHSPDIDSREHGYPAEIEAKEKQYDE
jgi:hypothetical protein